MMPRWFSQFAICRMFAVVRGNARVIVITEGISNIFFQWYLTYLPLYMLALGVSELEIGWLASISIVTQFISTLLGGYFADRFGRKRVLVVGDIVLWGFPLFLYTIASHPWYFLLGRFISGFIYIVVPSFECLFVEDVSEENRASVFALLQLLMAAGALLSPLAGYLVGQMGMVTAGRIIMFLTLLTAVGIALARNFTLVETSVGRERISATRQWNLRPLIDDFCQAFQAIVRQEQVRDFLVVRILAGFSGVIWMTYAMIFLTSPGGGRLPESSIAILPFVSALFTLAGIVLSAQRLGSRHIASNLAIGQGLGMVGSLVFILLPGGSIWLAVVWMGISALSTVLFQPASLSYWANIIEDRQRALIFSAATSLITVCTLPAGPLAGMLYQLSPRAPFLLALVLQGIVLGMVVTLNRKSARASRLAERQQPLTEL